MKLPIILVPKKKAPEKPEEGIFKLKINTIKKMERFFKTAVLIAVLFSVSGCNWTFQNTDEILNKEVRTAEKKTTFGTEDELYYDESQDRYGEIEKEEKELAQTDPMEASIKTLERVYGLSFSKKGEKEDNPDSSTNSFCPELECSAILNKENTNKKIFICIMYCNSKGDAEKVYKEKVKPQNFIDTKPIIGDQGAASDPIMAVNFRRKNLFITIKSEYEMKNNTNIEEIKYMARTIDIILPR